MKTATDYFDEIKAKYNLPSDYALAGLLGLGRSAVSLSRKNNLTLDEKTAHRVAELLEIDPAIIVAEMRAHLAKTDDVRNTWARIADFFRDDDDHDGESGNSTKTKEKTALTDKNQLSKIISNSFGLLDYDKLNRIYIMRSELNKPPQIQERHKH